MNKLNSYILVLVLFWAFAQIANAQNKTICGKTVDANTNQPLSFVNVWIENTVIGTTSDADGNFCINIDDIKKDTIVISFSSLAYQKQTQKINPKSNVTLTILMNPAITTLAEVVVTTNKNVNSVREQTVISKVISKDAIIASGAQNIPELLLKQPGVSLAGQSYHSAPSIRGLARKRVVVMLDGEKVSSERNVGAPGTFINPFEIERIEILKGPYSTLYGSDAVGGVVNIISKSYEQPFYNDKIGGRLDMSYKSVSNGKNANLALNGKLNKVLYHINAGYRDVDNYKIPSGGELMNSFYEEKHFAGRVIYNINKNNQLTFKTYYSKGGPIGKPAYDTLTNAVHNYDIHFIAGINYKMTNISKYLSKTVLNLTRHSHELGVVIEKHKQETNPNDDKLINNEKYLDGADYIAQYDMYFTINSKLKILTGFDGYFRNNINISEHKVVRNYNSGIFMMEKADTLLTDASQNSYGIFAQADYLLTDKFFINAGIRWNYIATNLPEQSDKNKENSAFSGNFGLSYSVLKRFSIKANIGSAFRVPDIKELYVTTNTPGGKNISNPDLIPEQSLNLDLGFVYQGKTNLIELSLFRNQINNMIILDWDNTTNPRTGTFKNIGEGLLYGLEFSYSQKITKQFSGYFNLTQIYGYDLIADDELMDVPPFQLNAGLNYDLNNKLWFTILGRYSGEQINVAEGDFTNKAFTTVDFSARWMIMKNLKLNFSVSNILNEKYREHYQFDWMFAPARSFNFGVNYNF